MFEVRSRAHILFRHVHGSSGYEKFANETLYSGMPSLLWRKLRQVLTSCPTVVRTVGMTFMTIGQLLGQRRRRKGWSQRYLSRRTGISQPRLSQLERGRRRATSDELEILDRFLNLPDNHDSVEHRLPLPSACWRMGRPEVVLEGDVPATVRLARARKSFGALADELLGGLERSPNVAHYALFLKECCLDSADEAMFWLHGFAAGGTVCRFAPMRAGFRQHAVLDKKFRLVGDVRVPCLEILDDPARILLFPQVRIDTRKACYRLVL